MSKLRDLQPGLFDSTSLGWGFDLGTGGSSGTARFHEIPSDADPILVLPEPRVTHVPALTYRLLGDRRLAIGWKARAGDNIAAIRLMRQIESEGRPATAVEQERLARFTGFGATDLANSFFRRPGEASGRAGRIWATS